MARRSDAQIVEALADALGCTTDELASRVFVNAAGESIYVAPDGSVQSGDSQPSESPQDDGKSGDRSSSGSAGGNAQGDTSDADNLKSAIRSVLEDMGFSKDSKPADSKPADTKPADSKPADTKPADSKPNVVNLSDALQRLASGTGADTKTESGKPRGSSIWDMSDKEFKAEMESTKEHGWAEAESA